MKRGFKIILFFCFILLLTNINAEAIVTGKATNQKTGISVFVLPSVPVLKIISPENISYNQGEYILLDYTAILINTTWYNLDNGSNITINSSLYFLPSSGEHTLYLYGNESNGTILSDKVSFYVIPTPSHGVSKKEIIVNKTIPINIEKEKINISLKQGESKIVPVLIRNDYNEKVKVNLQRTGLEEFLTGINQTEFYLDVGESRELRLNFTASVNSLPDLYLGKLVINTKNNKKEILLSLEIESAEFLFDVKLQIPEEPKTYKPGENILAKIDFYNLRGIGQTDVNIEYIIKDEEGNIFFGEKQILIIGKKISLTKVFTLPENIPEGNYVFYIKVTYDSKTASASKWFVVEKPFITLNNLKSFFSKIWNMIKEFFKNNGRALAELTGGMLGIYAIIKFISLLKRRIYSKRIKSPIKTKRYSRRIPKTKSKKRKKSSNQASIIRGLLERKK
ncbi:hypothetical protein DRN73_09530 [Candidatus Pacearchaeota archaeon]|nr:MAG: hypothetical protein DRN73_09530 [Candidatus Pacearchaeota archaeon]